MGNVLSRFRFGGHLRSNFNFNVFVISFSNISRMLLAVEVSENDKNDVKADENYNKN